LLHSVVFNLRRRVGINGAADHAFAFSFTKLPDAGSRPVSAARQRQQHPLGFATIHAPSDRAAWLAETPGQR
jgi:hypothetical protein